MKKRLSDRRAYAIGIVVMGVLGACSQSAPPETGTAPTAAAVGATVVTTLEARFNPTSAVGGGINASNAVTADDVKGVFASVPQVDKLRVTANSSPPGAKGGDVTSVSVIAQDGGGLLKGLDQSGKRSLGEAILTAAGTAWPNATISLLVTDPTGSGGQIIGSRPPGGQATLIVS